MSSIKLVAFIISSGPHIGKSLASRLREKGYSAAVGSRTPGKAPQEDGTFSVTVDASKPEGIQEAFTRVTAELGHPNTVIYNLSQRLYSSTTSSLKIPNNDVLKAFIVIGSLFPFLPATPELFAIGAQNLLRHDRLSIVNNSYKNANFRFHYTTLVSAKGGFVTPVDFMQSAPTHAKVYDATRNHEVGTSKDIYIDT
ncbi:hypothetical protein BDN72DRAFT_960584 [Pluteus cervinus]|uniref:Uncharacterized protein n=1 Tax=Pluteus cervinus TaxID=181527 RepID=A0ACD3AQJ3_9AGAR|nr:hypothetical protein BDN72DRAFT_960584 [Pluteus cervinus]